jgi:hypothetical protein
VIDTVALLEFIDKKTESPYAVVASIYAGLAERIRRGDFNTERSDEE